MALILGRMPQAACLVSLVLFVPLRPNFTRRWKIPRFVLCTGLRQCPRGHVAKIPYLALPCEMLKKTAFRCRSSVTATSTSTPPFPYAKLQSPSLASDNSKMQSCESLSRAQIRMDGRPTQARSRRSSSSQAPKEGETRL